MDVRRLGQVVAIVLVGVLIENWRLVTMVLYPRDAVVFLIGGTWLALLVASGAGLVQGKRWGAYTLMVLAPYSAALLATPLIPGISQLLGIRGPFTVVALNVVVLGIAGFLAYGLARPRQREAAA
jgi:hypothetical protein